MAEKPYVDIPDMTLGIDAHCLFFPVHQAEHYCRSPLSYITVKEAELILKYLDEIQDFVSKHGTGFSNIPDHESELERD